MKRGKGYAIIYFPNGSVGGDSSAYDANNGVISLIVTVAVNGHTVTAKEMLSLPVAEMISMEEFEQRVKEEKIEKWADPSYVLTREEKKEAKELIREFYREEYDRFDMDEEARQKTYKIVMLENKTNPGAGVMAGIMEEMPFSGKMIKVLDNEYRKMEEASGIEGGYNVSETMQALENQSPTAYMSGRIITEGAEFYAGAKLFAKIPVVKKISNAVGAKVAAAAGRKGLSAGAQQMIAARTSEIVSGKLFDTATDTVPNVIKDVRQGEELPEIGKHALETEAKDLAIGAGSEAAAGAVSAAFSKIGKALRGGNEAVEGIVREGAEEAQELIEGGVTAKAASVPEVKPKPEPELEKGEVEKAVSVPEATPKPKSKPRLENNTVEEDNPVPKEETRQRYDQEFEGGTDLVKFNIDEIRPQLETEPDTAFFWSGKTDGVGGAEVAADIAKGKGGVTLESTIEAKDITMPEWDFNDPSSMDAWDMASAAYAEQVSGEVRAVVGTELRPDNIWENVELPRLMENPNVTKITIIDPKTGIETVIFER